jgi:hypothetical protein
MAKLERGWFDPESPSLDPNELIRFRALMNMMISRGVPSPYLYPTPEGGAQAEWSFPAWEVSVSMSQRGGDLHLHATNLQSDLSRDQQTSISAPDAIDTLLAFMSEFTS